MSEMAPEAVPEPGGEDEQPAEFTGSGGLTLPPLGLGDRR